MVYLRRVRNNHGLIPKMTKNLGKPLNSKVNSHNTIYNRFMSIYMLFIKIGDDEKYRTYGATTSDGANFIENPNFNYDGKK